MGGMNFPEAYRFVFDVDLRDRLRELVSTYGEGIVNTELTVYGWETAEQLRDLLKRIEPDYLEQL